VGKKIKRFIDEFSKGKFGLPRTFWLGLILGSMIINMVLMVFLPTWLNSIFSTESQSISDNIFLIGILSSQGYVIFAMISTWRASNLYEKNSFWGTVAKGVVFIYGFQVLGILTNTFSAWI